MKDTKKRNAIVAICLTILVVAIPIYGFSHYRNETQANNQAIANDQAEMRRLKNKRQQKLSKIYQRKQNIKELNDRLHDDTNLLLRSQQVLLKDQHHQLKDATRANQAETDMAKITAQAVNLDNNLLFNYPKQILTLAASYPAEYRVDQEQIPVIIHAYDQSNKEIAFAVCDYDPNDHVFKQVDLYSITRQKKEPKNQGTDYNSYKKKEAAAKRQAAQKKAQAKKQAQKEKQAKVKKSKSKSKQKKVK